MRSFTIISLALALIGFFVQQISAYQIKIDSYTCTRFSWSIQVSQQEYQAAYYATFYVSDVANSNDFINCSENITSSQTHAIQTWDTWYDFTCQANSVTPPAGSAWTMGVALNDVSGDSIAGEVLQTTVNNACTTSASSTPISLSQSGSSSSTTSTATTSTSVSPSTSTSANPVRTSQASSNHSKVGIPGIVGGIVGAVLFVIAVTAYLILRRRNAKQKTELERMQQQQQGGGARSPYGASPSDTEKGFVFNAAPVQQVNTLPRDRSSGMSGFTAAAKEHDVDRDTSDYAAPQPPMSPPMSSAWGVDPSATSPRPTSYGQSAARSDVTSPRASTFNFSASPPAATEQRANNPLFNFSPSGWSSAAGSTGTRFGAAPSQTQNPLFGSNLPSPSVNASAPSVNVAAESAGQRASALPEPMSRH